MSVAVAVPAVCMMHSMIQNARSIFFFFFAVVCFEIDTFANICAGKAVTCMCLCWGLWGREPVKIFEPPLIPVMVMLVVLS